MHIQNSYIFLPTPFEKEYTPTEEDKGVIEIKTGRSFHSYIMKAFPLAEREHDNYDLLQQKYSITIKIEKMVLGVSVISKNVGDSHYVNVIAEGRAKTQIISALEVFHEKLFATGIEDDYVSITSYDAVSEYYCNKLYPKLNELERGLRKLLFNIYVSNFGREYFRTTITKELQEKIKKRVQAKGGKEKKESEYLKLFFYSFEYNDIQQLLFDPHWTKIDEASKAAFLNEHADLSQISDMELRTMINSISPKSDWERFFVEKFDDVDLKSDIEIVRPIRNRVAHCKFLCKEDYIDSDKIIRKLNSALKKAIDITEEKDFADKNAENFRKAFSIVSTLYNEFKSKLSEAFLPSMQKLREFSVSVPTLPSKILGLSRASNSLDTVLKKLADIYSQIQKIGPFDYNSDLDMLPYYNQREENTEEELEDEDGD